MLWVTLCSAIMERTLLWLQDVAISTSKYFKSGSKALSNLLISKHSPIVFLRLCRYTAGVLNQSSTNFSYCSIQGPEICSCTAQLWKFFFCAINFKILNVQEALQNLCSVGQFVQKLKSWFFFYLEWPILMYSIHSIN